MKTQAPQNPEQSEEKVMEDDIGQQMRKQLTDSFVNQLQAQRNRRELSDEESIFLNPMDRELINVTDLGVNSAKLVKMVSEQPKVARELVKMLDLWTFVVDNDLLPDNRPEVLNSATYAHNLRTILTRIQANESMAEI